MPEQEPTVPCNAWHCNAYGGTQHHTQPPLTSKSPQPTWRSRFESATTVMKCLAAAATLATATYPWIAMLL
ncbi:hypothetical protein RKD37_004523 [Streptomyces ambofaciens]